jgi:pimeloyl-ACP methyl ester carboxylesterase
LSRDTLVRSGLSPERADQYLRFLADPGVATAAINWYRGQLFRWRPAERNVSVPVLYIYGTKDHFLGRKAADLTRHCVDGPYRLEVLEGATHWLPEEHPETVAKLVLEHAAAR